MIYVLLILFLLFMAGDVYGRIKGNDKIVTICQPGTTIIVLIIALRSLTLPVFLKRYTFAIAIGLSVAVIADAILVNRNDPKGFIKGMVLFLITILVYGSTWTMLSGFHKSDVVITIGSLIAYGVLFTLFKKLQYKDKRRPSKITFIGASVYMLIFCLVISRGISTLFWDIFTTQQSIFIIVGASLFFLGDLQLGIYHFIDVHFPMKQAPPFYFIGQLCIALSCSFF